MWIFLAMAAWAGEGDDLESELYGTAPATKPAPAPATKPPTAAPAPTATPAPVAAAPAPAPDAWATTLVEALVALPDHAARRARLTTELGTTTDGERAGRLGQALAVIGHLERTKRTDPSIVRMFLRAALSPDPATRAAAVEAASRGGDPPVGAAAPAPGAPVVAAASVVAPAAPVAASVAPAVAASPPLAVLREYKRRHLVRGSLDITSTGAYPVTYGNYTVYRAWQTTESTWGIRDGGGALLGTKTFARAVSDTATVRRLEDEEKNAKAWMTGLLVGGIASTLVGTGMILSDPDPSYGAVAAPGLLVVGGGVTLGALCWVPPVRAKVRQKYVKNYYSPARADELIEKYNAAIRADLHLTEEDVKDLDLQPGG